ncbi:MAG: ATP-binding protein [Thermodesulfovibrionales bacterium]
MTGDRVSVTVPSHPKYLCVIRDITARMADISGMDGETVDQVKLAVDEACANVIKHAYRGDTTKTFSVKFRVKEEQFEVVIEDSGPKADPSCLRGRDLDDIRPGGLGVHFIKRVFDSFAFDKRKKKGNRLRLIKRLDRGNDHHPNT